MTKKGKGTKGTGREITQWEDNIHLNRLKTRDLRKDPTAIITYVQILYHKVFKQIGASQTKGLCWFEIELP